MSGSEGSSTSPYPYFILVQVHPSTGPAKLHLNSLGQFGGLHDQTVVTHAMSKMIEIIAILLENP